MNNNENILVVDSKRCKISEEDGLEHYKIQITKLIKLDNDLAEKIQKYKNYI